MDYTVLGVYVIIILVLVPVTFSTRNTKWFTTSLILLSGSVGLLTLRISEEYSAQNIPPELLADGSYNYMIYIWPVIIAVIFFGVGWLTRPKENEEKRHD
ncbi:MAG: hypothetical protein HYT93_01735 [Parcubacteria group bacterium]|nr:hypothetical protein [Parcubacteria group bacterium]